MKKIFTSIAMAAIAVFSVGAETVTANFQTYTNADGYRDYLKPFELEINKEADGSYSMPNFMNSGSAVSFTFTEPKVNKSAEIKLTSNNESVATAWEWGEGYEDWYALLDANGDALELKGERTDGSNIVIYDPVIITADGGYLYAYVKKLDTSDGKNEYNYYADINICAYPEDNDDGDYFYLSFYFDKAEGSAVEAVASESNAPVEFYNLNGVRVVNPSNGIFIRKQGGDVKKVIIK